MTSTMTRRAAIGRAAIATAATALPALPAIASSPQDPIFALIAECDRLRALAEEANSKAGAAERSAPGPVCGLPDFPENVPALEPMRRWLLARKPDWTPEHGVTRHQIEEFNEMINNFPLGRGTPKVEQRRREMGEERLAWWDREIAKRHHNAEVSGYWRYCDESEELWNRHGDAQWDVMHAKPITVAGALAQLRIAIRGIRDGNTVDGEFHGDFDNYGVFNAYDTLARLLPA